MIKKLIEPLQKVLIQKKICPACTRPLSKATILESRMNGTSIVECECTRLFIYNKNLDVFHRALPSEVKKYLK